VKIANILAAWPKKVIALDDLRKQSEILEYDEFYLEVQQYVESGVLSAIKSSQTNGRRNPLFKKYRIQVPTQVPDCQKKIRFLHPALLKNGWLLSHIEEYPKWQSELEALDHFFCHPNSYKTAVSKKERSYQLFGEEKLLESREFAMFFHRIGLFLTDLNCYETPEPLFDYILNPSSAMTLLICENKDIWYNLRRLMLEERKRNLFGLSLDGIIYGEGNKITEEKKLDVYLRGLGARSAEFWYWGDIDKEGFDIFLRLQSKNPGRTIHLFSRGYEEMIHCAGQKTPQKDQSRDRDYNFNRIYHALSDETLLQVRNLLDTGHRIPQEAVNYEILKENMK
jgi:hypothetical protein